MPASEEIVGGIPTLIGLGAVAVALSQPHLLGQFYDVAFGGGLLLMCIGPVIQATALEHFANFNNALGATIEPDLNGKRTIYFGKVETIAHPDSKTSGKQFRSKVHLLKPRLKLVTKDGMNFGVLRYFYVDHDMGFWDRVYLRKGKGSYMGVIVQLRGIDGNVVLSRHPVPIIDDFGPVPVFDLIRAGWDWPRQNGDLSAMDSFEEAPAPKAN